MLAREGFTGSPNVFDATLSFWDVYRWEGQPGPPAQLVVPGTPLMSKPAKPCASARRRP
jgi:hypothetical protein